MYIYIYTPRRGNLVHFSRLPHKLVATQFMFPAWYPAAIHASMEDYAFVAKSINGRFVATWFIFPAWYTKIKKLLQRFLEICNYVINGSPKFVKYFCCATLELGLSNSSGCCLRYDFKVCCQDSESLGGAQDLHFQCGLMGGAQDFRLHQETFVQCCRYRY